MRISTFRASEREPAVGLSIGTAVVALHAGAEALGDGAAEVPRDLLGIIEAGPETWELAESFDTTLSECELPAEGQGKWWWQVDDVKFEVPFKPRKNPWANMTPEQLERQRLGIWVILFLIVFLIFSYLLKVEIWKDIK